VKFLYLNFAVPSKYKLLLLNMQRKSYKYKSIEDQILKITVKVEINLVFQYAKKKKQQNYVHKKMAELISYMINP